MSLPWSAWTLPAALALGPACNWSVPPTDETPAHRAVRIPRPIAPADEGTSEDLLQAYAKRDPITRREADLWELPYQSKRLVVALLIIASQDRLEDLDLVLTPDAAWGLPETRRFGARPIFGSDRGEAFLSAFRRVAARFGAKAKWQTQPLPTGPEGAVRSGAEPLWSFYANGNDRIYFREVLYRGVPRIDYVGMFEDLPTDPVKVVGHGVPVPMGPPARHAPGGEAADEPVLDEPAFDPQIPVPTPD
jgi:hypothetical protein